MPTCPGCGREVPYPQLGEHIHTCKWIWSDRPEEEPPWAEQLAEQVYRLEERLARHESAGRTGRRVLLKRNEDSPNN